MKKLTIEEIKGVLSYIDPSSLNYQEWLNVGMALKHEGFDAFLFEEWSRSDKRHKDGECLDKWETFKEEAGNIVTIGTVIEMAKSNGWSKSKKKGHAFEWNDTIKISGPQSEYTSDSDEFEPNIWNPKNELIRYLQTLFNEDDKVSYVVKSRVTTKSDGTTKYVPADKGVSDRTAGQLIEELRNTDSIEKVLGDYDHEAGAWIRFNPMDGQGAGNKNVTDYRYALVESDSMELSEQVELIKRMQLPVAVLMYSGGKSVHAIVKIEARSAVEYSQRVKQLYKVCADNGMTIDTQNKNPARLSRMPGCDRGERKQYIIDTDIGQPSWTDWMDFVEEEADDLPEFETLESVWNNMPPLAPELIEGVLRQGHKMLIAGPSKAGKSYSMVELAICIAEGKKWLGHQCAQGKVLYINLEIDRPSFFDRMKKVYEAFEYKPKHLGDLEVWNLRGRAMPMSRLTPKLIKRAKEKGFIAIIIDPIYKVQDGDENSAAEVARFCNEFDKICTELHASLIYVHHHSKGNQSGKKAMDRASGSGVWMRDVDASIDFLEYTLPEELEVEGKDITAWKVEYTIREFPNRKPIYITFDYPIHIIDSDGIIEENAKPADDPQQKGADSTKNKGQRNFIAFEQWFSFVGTGSPMAMKNIYESYNSKFKEGEGFSKSTIQNWLKKLIEGGRCERIGDGSSTRYSYRTKAEK